MEDFVNIELAIKLKELGYNAPFFFFYRTDDKLIRHAMVNNPLVYGKSVDDEVVIAPTISQVMKWLRDEKDIFIEITVDVNDKFNYYFEIYKKGNDTWEYIGQNDTYDYFEMYEEAALAGVKYTLDNLI